MAKTPEGPSHSCVRANPAPPLIVSAAYGLLECIFEAVTIFPQGIRRF